MTFEVLAWLVGTMLASFLRMKNLEDADLGNRIKHKISLVFVKFEMSSSSSMCVYKDEKTVIAWKHTL